MKRAIIVALAVCACASAASQAQSRAAQPPKFVKRIDNPWYPLKPGTTYIYTGRKDGKRGRDVFKVTSHRKKINGVECTEVDDRLYLNGYLAERTKDWYAQDKRGNVWYFGEATAELDKSGHVLNREGSWRAGVDGAQAGILVPGHPQVGQRMRQEYYKGHAEDHFAVLSLSASVVVPYTASAHALLTKEWTPLEPDVIDHKLYIRGIGLAKEETIKGGDELFELTDIRHQ